MSNDHAGTEEQTHLHQLSDAANRRDPPNGRSQQQTNTVQVRPIITPNVFNGGSSTTWDEWVGHFESVSQVNGWDDRTRLLWLEVMMTGKARNAWKRLKPEAKAQYETAKLALHQRFEPDCQRNTM